MGSFAPTIAGAGISGLAATLDVTTALPEPVTFSLAGLTLTALLYRARRPMA